jgi:hypothetical protein
MARDEEDVEHLGRVETWLLDLDARWQVDSALRRIDDDDGDVICDIRATMTAEPSVVWAHLTSPALRSLWEGPLVIEESSPGGLRGVGTVARCVTGRLATLEEIVDWQPYDHVGWRLAVPDVGPVVASADLEPAAGGTGLRLRWTYQGHQPLDGATADRLRGDKEAGLGRLASVLARSVPLAEPSAAG